MKIETVLRRISLLAVVLIVSGCGTCSVHCSRGEPMARPAIALRDVHFGYDSSELTPTAQETLREDFNNLDLARSGSSASIVLEGRADERGDTKYNESLSQRRVSEVRRYLVKLGATETRFDSVELGETSPIETGSSPDVWAKNRSVRVLVR